MFHHGPSPTSRFVFSAALVLLVSSMVGSVSCASDLPDIPPIERLGTVSSTFTERTQRITTNTDVAIVHNQLLSTIFDPVPWPITTQATLVATYDSASFPSLNSVGIPTAGVSKVEELSFTTSINGLSHDAGLPSPARSGDREEPARHRPPRSRQSLPADRRRRSLRALGHPRPVPDQRLRRPRDVHA
jgi:hypothetical protein